MTMMNWKWKYKTKQRERDFRYISVLIREWLLTKFVENECMRGDWQAYGSMEHEMTWVLLIPFFISLFVAAYEKGKDWHNNDS